MTQAFRFTISIIWLAILLIANVPAPASANEVTRTQPIPAADPLLTGNPTAEARADLGVLAAPPAMKLPFHKSLAGVRFTSGPHNGSSITSCTNVTLSGATGIDFSLNGQQVLNVANGTFRSMGTDTASGIGKYLYIDIGGGWTVGYWHLASFDPAFTGMATGTPVPQGKPIGVSGTAGTGPHLHLELRYQGSTAGVNWHGVTIDGYTVYAMPYQSDSSRIINYQGTLIRGNPTTQNISYAFCNNAAVRKTVGSELTIEAGSTQALVSTNEPPSTVTRCGTPSGQFCVEYFNNIGTSGNPVFIRNETALNVDWGSGGPGNGVGVDNFSYLAKGRFSFDAADYTFVATADDGIRIWIDGALILDKWIDQPPTTYRVARSLSAGEHTVQVAYYERGGGAVARVSWERASQTCSIPSGQFCVEYFNNVSLSGSPTFIRNESVINFNWGQGGPGNGVGNDNFSLRSQGNFFFEDGSYVFSATADDGVRVWLDGGLIIDGWRDQGATTYRTTRTLNRGNHTVKIEYYERGGDAVAQLRWDRQSSTRTEVVIDDRDGNFSRSGAYWWESAIGYNGHMWWTYVNGGTVSSAAEWRATLGGGNYEVYVFIPNSNATTRNARYEVFHGGGTAVRAVNQNAYYDAWVSLGTYSFSSGTDRRVRLTDATGEAGSTAYRIGFDAVKFVPR